ncbi:MAG: hypothetical protein NW226_24370 [Microscillaceae bacterium]|nr:hypothetical protein [Microscillaceae bacterium]
MKLSFDEKGYLQPARALNCDLADFEQYFVNNFPNSNTRHKLFVNYMRYIEHFSKYITRKFTHCIDGSFVTLKENPKNIDLVMFIDYQVYEAHENHLDKYWSFNLENQDLDAYLIKSYPEDHPFFEEYLQKCQEWQRLYTNVKRNFEIVPESKGFLNIKFE